MRMSDFKVGRFYYAEVKNPSFKYHGPDLILNIFKVIAKGISPNGEVDKRPKLVCTPLVSNWNAQWYSMRPREVINAHEVKLEDLPLFIDWPEKAPAYFEYLKNGLANQKGAK